MIRSQRRTFLTVFLVVFLGGVGVSGAAALWSLQTTVTAQVATGTWAAQPSVTPTPTPTTTSWPWAPAPSTFQVTALRKNPARVRLAFPTWTHQSAPVYVVKAPGGSVVVVDSRSGTATIDYPDQGCYSVRVSAGTSSSNQSAPVEMKLRFDNGGGSEGTATIGGADLCR